MNVTEALIVATLSLHPTQTPLKNNDLFCLSTAIYHEARSLPTEGQLAVAHVVKTRWKRAQLLEPSHTLCRVLRTKGQFSWVRKPQKSRRKLEDKAWTKAVLLASQVLNNQTKDPTKGATHFCLTSELNRVSWCRNAKVTLVVANKRFVIPKEP